MVKVESSELKLGVIIILLIMLFGCQSIPHQPVQVIQKEKDKKKDQKVEERKKKKKSHSVEWLQRPIGEDVLVDLDKKTKEGSYLMNFPNEIEIPKFIDAMMSGVFKLNYLMTNKVKQQKTRFTIKMTEDLSRGETFKLFKKILELHKIRIEKEANTYIFSTAVRSQFTLKGPIVYGRRIPSDLSLNDSDEVTFLIPFQNINPTMVQTLLGKQLTPPNNMSVIKELNLLLINGRFGEVRYVLSLVDLIDRVQFREKSIVMLRPKYWNIDEFTEKVKELLEAEGVNWKAAEQTKSLVFIPIRNLNYLLLISSSREWAERVIYWLKKMDIPDAAGESKKVFLYKLRNVEVDSVIKVLEDFQKKSLMIPTRTGRPTRAAQKQPSGQPREKILIPIKETNSIVIVADPVEYKKYVDILRMIDVPRNQIFVEVIIGEVSIDTSTQLGLEFWINKYLYKSEFGTRGGLGVFKGGDEAGNIVIPSGSNLFVKGVLPGSQYELLINALVTNSKINIISSPKLTVVENEEAEIKVGASVPTISGESAMGGAHSGTTQTGQATGYYYPYRQIIYIETGIIFKIKGAILSDNKISLEINQEISEAQENTKSNISSPEILRRSIKTTMIVSEGEIGFIGGLIQTKKTSGKSGIPVLSKIPLIGNLFKKTSKTKRKTELVFFINAKIIKRANQMRTIVNEVKKIISEHSYLRKEDEKK